MVENCENPSEGMNENRDEAVYVKSINGKTTRIQCDKEQGIVRIKDEVERKTMTPKDLQHFVNQEKKH